MQMLHDLLPWDTSPIPASRSAGAPVGKSAHHSPQHQHRHHHHHHVTAEGGPASYQSRGLRDGPTADTIRGVAFLHLHGRDLGEAWEWVHRYLRTRREVDLLQVSQACRGREKTSVLECLTAVLFSQERAALLRLVVVTEGLGEMHEN